MDISGDMSKPDNAPLPKKKKKIKRQLVKLLWPRQKKKKTKASVGWGKTNKQKNKKQEQLRESS